MKNKPIKKLSALACIVFMLCLLCSCVSADIVISGEAYESSATSTNYNDTTALIVNISSGTFHLDENCRYVLKTKEENTGEQTVVEESVNNPATSDNVISYIIMLFLSTIGLLSIFLNKKITN